MLPPLLLPFILIVCGQLDTARCHPARHADDVFRIDDAIAAASSTTDVTSFDCPTPAADQTRFLRLDPSNTNSTVILSMSNYLLEMDLRGEIAPVRGLRTGPQDNYVKCEYSSRCSALVKSCDREQKSCVEDGSNVMAISHGLNLFMSCGNVRNCIFRKLSDITKPYQETGTATNACDNSNILIEHKQEKGAERRYTYSREMFDRDGSHYLMIAIDGKGMRTYRVAGSDQFTYELVDDTTSYVELDATNYLKIFTHDSFVYSVYNDKSNQTKLFRICMNSSDDYIKVGMSAELDKQKSGKGSFNSVTIKCPSDAGVLEKASTVEFLDETLIFFHKLASSSQEIAVCKISIADIDKAVRKAREDCSNGNGLAELEFFTDSDLCKKQDAHWITCGPRDRGPGLSQFSFQAGFPFGIKTILETKMQSIIRMPSVDEKPISFQTFVFNDALYTFVGTTLGNAYKFILKTTTAKLAEKVMISEFPIIQIRSGVSNSKGEAEKIVALTKKEISTFKAESCESLYGDCQSCLTSQDPFCGWCIYQARCTTVGTCEQSPSQERWISTSRDSTECPSFTVDPHSVVTNSAVDARASFTGVELTLNDSFTMNVSLADFNQEFSIITRATNRITFQIPQLSSDLLEEGTDHTPASLILNLNGRPISKSVFTLFDCTRIRQAYPTKACSACLAQKWSCYWCPITNSCSNKMCGGGTFSINQCPKTTNVVSSTEILSGVREMFEISAINLDIDKSYTCKIYSCNGEIFSTRAEVKETTSGNFLVSCNATASQLTCKERESVVKIRVLMGEHIIDQQRELSVTVYNCAIDSPLCGQCINLHAEFAPCIWCNSTSSCSNKLICQDTPVEDMSGCELPRITSISPNSAPTQGGTIVTIEGTNIGSSTEDIVSIKVGNTSCAYINGTYTIARSLQCRMQESDFDVTSQVHILTTYGALAKSIETFSFKPVKMKTFPITEVINDSIIKVRGENLDSGNSVKLILESQDGQKKITVCNDRKSEAFNCSLPNMPKGMYMAKIELDSFSSILTQNFSYEEKPKARAEKNGMTAFNRGGGKGKFIVNTTAALLKWMTINLLVEENIMDCYVVKMPTDSTKHAEIECQLPPNPQLKNDRSFNNETLPSKQKRSTVEAYLIYNNDRDDKKYVGEVQYLRNPEFGVIKELPCPNSENGTIFISANDFGKTGLNASDYKVYFSPSGEDSEQKRVECQVHYIDKETLFCRVRSTKLNSLGNTKVKIIAQTGDLVIETSDDVIYCPGPNRTWLYAVVPVLVIMLICIFLVLRKLHQKSQKQRKERKMLMSKLDDLENATRETARNEYFQLQTGYMEDFTQNISHKINYRSPTKYFAQTFFNKTENIPVLSNAQIGDDELKQIESFENLLRNEEFLLFFITTLEEQKNFNVLQKGELASLLAVSFYEDLPYFTKVMLKLLADVIKAQSGKNPKLLLRRSASVVEKMVSHWLSITMYDEYIYEQSGKPLFLLTKAIHYLVNLAPWDVTADKAVNSLNEMTLLGNKASYNTIDINASVQGCETGETTIKPKLIKVLDLDTITQAKEKIIEGLFSDQPYSEQRKPKDLELVLFRPDAEPKVLSDIDGTSAANGIYVKINTLEHYGVRKDDTVLLRPCAANTEQNMMNEENEPLLARKKKLYHLISPKELAPEEVEEGGKHADKMIQKLIKTPLQEMFLTRMVKAKSTVQVYVNNVMKSILKPEKIPKAVCYFFGFLDGEAAKNKITDPEILHIWKTNSLLLRYWVNILKNPEFVFDIQKTTIVDSCLNVITQAFMDGCTVTNVKLSKDAPSNKLLYAKDVMEYKIWVKEFYSNVSNQNSVDKDEMDNFLLGLSKKFKVEFNRIAALQQMLGLLKKYSKEILAIMRANENIYIRNEAYYNVENILKLGNGEVSFPSPQEISV